MKAWQVKWVGSWLLLLTGIAAVCFDAHVIASILFSFGFTRPKFRIDRGRALYPWEWAVIQVLVGMAVLFWIYLLWRSTEPLPDWVIIWWRPVAVVAGIPLVAYVAWQDYFSLAKAYRSLRSV